MAFLRQVGKTFQVRKGDNGQMLSTFGSKAEADEEIRMLHSEHDPQSANRGKPAKKRLTQKAAVDEIKATL